MVAQVHLNLMSRREINMTTVGCKRLYRTNNVVSKQFYNLYGELGLVLLRRILGRLRDSLLTRLVEDIVTPPRWEVEALMPCQRVELVVLF